MDFGLEGHTATFCGESIVVVGGKTSAFSLSDSVFALRLPTFEWRRLVCDGAVPMPRAYHSACLHGSRLVVFGGITSVGLNDVHYNTYNVFTMADGLDRATLQQTGADRFREPSSLRPLMPQKIEADGEVHILDMSTLPPRWESVQCTGNVPCNRSHHAAAMQGNTMYIVGGYNIYSPQTQPTFDFGCLFRLDLITLCWTRIELSIPLYYWGATLTPLGGSLFCLFGGVSRERNRESHDTFFLDAKTGSVRCVVENSCTPLPRAAHSAWRWGCYVYIFGGAGSVATRYFNGLHRLYVQRGAWEVVLTEVDTQASLSSLSASIPPLSGCAAVVVGEHVFLVGGMRSNFTRLSSVFLIDMRSLTWREAETTFANSPPRFLYTHSEPYSNRGNVSRGVQTAWKGGELSHAPFYNALAADVSSPCRTAGMRRLQHESRKENGELEHHYEERPQERCKKELDELHALTEDWSNMMTDLSTRVREVAWTS